jgi:hypothetical protein
MMADNPAVDATVFAALLRHPLGTARWDCSFIIIDHTHRLARTGEGR